MTGAGGPVFDFHARLLVGRAVPPDRSDGTDALLAAMDDAGISRAVVSAGGLIGLDRLAAQINDGGRAEVAADNAGVLLECSRSDGRLLPFFFADPLRDVASYRAAVPDFRGLEVSPAVHGFRLGDPAVTELVRIAASAGHPVYLVCLGRAGARTGDLVLLARGFPDVTFVWGHCGHTGLDVAGLAEIAEVPNILAETSGCLTVTARLAAERLGPHRVLFGTEYPLQHPRVELAKAGVLGLDPLDLSDFLWGNACRVLAEEATWKPR